jgi:hypothetical protein
MSSNWQPQVPVEEIKAGPIEGGPDGVEGSENGTHDGTHDGPRKRVVVVGLGMVGISFMFVSSSNQSLAPEEPLEGRVCTYRRTVRN